MRAHKAVSAKACVDGVYAGEQLAQEHVRQCMPKRAEVVHKACSAQHMEICISVKLCEYEMHSGAYSGCVQTVVVHCRVCWIETLQLRLRKQAKVGQCCWNNQDLVKHIKKYLGTQRSCRKWAIGDLIKLFLDFRHSG